MEDFNIRGMLLYSKELEQKYIEQYKLLHTMKNHPKKYGYGDGSSTHKRLDYIKFFIKKFNVKSVLDFGCGKGIHHTVHNMYQPYGVEKVFLYDPAVEQFNVLTDEVCDMIVSGDVFEHIPEQNLDDAIEKISTRCSKIVFLSISCLPAFARLPNGENAHTTIRPPEWWIEKFINAPGYNPNLQYYGVFDTKDVRMFYHINNRKRLKPL